MSSDTYTSKIRECIRELVTIDQQIISQLKQLKNEVDCHQKDCRAMKAVGTSYSAVGTVASMVGLCLAPFTADISLTITAGGVASTVYGVGVNIVTGIYDNIKTKNYIKTLNNLTKQHDKAAAEFREIIEKMKEIVEELQSKHNYDTDTAIVATLAFELSNLGVRIKDIVAASEAIRIANITTTLKSTGSTITATIGKGGKSMSFVLGKPIADMTKAEMSGIVSVIKSPTSALGASSGVEKSVFNATVSVIGVAVAIWEIYDLVRNWDKAHPIINTISNLIKTLEAEERSIQSML